MGAQYDEIDYALAAAVPEFAAQIAEHLADNFGELLPHVLFGDFARFVLDAHARGDSDLLKRCLAFLEDMIQSGDAELENLVAVSFVENVGPWDRKYRGFIKGWPPHLRDEATRHRNWKPGTR